MQKLLAGMLFGVLLAAAGFCGAEEVKTQSPQAVAPTAVAAPVAKTKAAKSRKKAAHAGYICPMCRVKSDKPGKCPECGMEMVPETPKKAGPTSSKAK